jgi:hypothetical protein
MLEHALMATLNLASEIILFHDIANDWEPYHHNDLDGCTVVYVISCCSLFSQLAKHSLIRIRWRRSDSPLLRMQMRASFTLAKTRANERNIWPDAPMTGPHVLSVQ